MLKKTIHSLQIPAQLALLQDVRQFVEAHCLLVGASQQVAEHLVLATDEACSNIIMHGYGGDSKQPINIIFIHTPKAIEIRLQHLGAAFNPENYAPPSGLRASLMARKKGGWGIFIMQRLMDDVKFKSTKTQNEVRLLKKI
jgi:anti-sigma regulatory factor (Ser/Thr protein kinase)